jgi:hypothetical protein
VRDTGKGQVMTESAFIKKSLHIQEDLQKTRGCSVCSHITDVLDNFFVELQHQLFHDGPIRNNYADELGFCSFHTWQLATYSSPLGIAYSYSPLLEHVISALIARSERPWKNSKEVLYITKNSTTCSVCRFVKEVEKHYIKHLALFLKDAKGRQTYADSYGVCLRHLEQLVNGISSDTIIQFLLRDEAERFKRIDIDLQNYISKRNRLRRDLLTNDERDACRCALVKIVGERNSYTCD